MKKKHIKTLELLCCRPASGNIKWQSIESMLVELGADIRERTPDTQGTGLDTAYLWRRS
ncbi:MAG: hypothetical protein JKY62_15150 [Desulfocapsa sp.]|nr:hypothetical protein [Desulfocapsa sp.]